MDFEQGQMLDIVITYGYKDGAVSYGGMAHLEAFVHYYDDKHKCLFAVEPNDEIGKVCDSIWTTRQGMPGTRYLLLRKSTAVKNFAIVKDGEFRFMINCSADEYIDELEQVVPSVPSIDELHSLSQQDTVRHLVVLEYTSNYGIRFERES